MRTFPDVRMRALVEQAAYAQRLLQEHEYPAALVELRALEGRLAQLGLQSVWVKWALCVAHDLSDNPLAALDKINDTVTRPLQRGQSRVPRNRREAAAHVPARGHRG